MEIGVKIKQLRLQRGLTQEELAARTELTKGFISQVERELENVRQTVESDAHQEKGTR